MGLLEAFAPHAGQPGSVLFLSAGGSDLARRSYMAVQPDRVLSAPEAGFAAPHGFFQAQRGDGFTSGLAGLWGYELGTLTEGAPRPAQALAAWPDLWLGEYGAVKDFPAGAEIPAAGPAPGASVRATVSQAQYEARVQRARDYIRAGDVFQVNLSQRFEAVLAEGDEPYAFFQRLSAASPASHALYARLSADRALVSNSPELFLAVAPDGRIETRPIKGTAPRGATPEEDEAAARGLAASAKDRAENLMIVDLMRNDLSRVCEAGSVRAPKLFEVERLVNVHHLVSTVEGRLLPGKTAFDALGACFPPGSVTGAPKHRALEIIAGLEGETRGPYCGAFGFIDRGGAARFSVLIRSVALVRKGGRWRAQFRSGGAVTIDSDPAAEYRETLAKAGAILNALGAHDGELAA